MKAGSQSRQPKQPEQLSSQSSRASMQAEQAAVLPSSRSSRAAEQKQPVAACLTLKDWVCCWSAMNSSLPPGCNAWKVIARLQ